MRKATGLLALLCAAVGVVFWLNQSKTSAPRDPAISAPSNPSRSSQSHASSQTNATNQSAFRTTLGPGPQTNLSTATTTPVPATKTTVEPARPDIAPMMLMENMRQAFRDYAARYGGNPVGTNPEITRALNGENPRQTKFILPDSGLRINSAGELVDAWDTPFFFHQLSAKEMEIHSAGPDRVMWTKDDLVIK